MRPTIFATSRETILFDLDGTLTDPKVGIVRCIQHALATLGIDSPNEKDLESWIGPPIQDSFCSVLPSGDPELVDRALKLFRERFSDVGIYENVVYPGIPDLLGKLRETDRTLFVATSKPEAFARRILDHFNLQYFFAEVYGSAFDGTLSNKGELIAALLQSEALKPSQVLMVGDRKHDVLGAGKNDVPCVGVLYGYGSRAELVEAGAIALAENTTELLSLLCL